jgi:hypothetical protein
MKTLYYNEIKTLTKRVALAEPRSESGWWEPTGELNVKITSESPPERFSSRVSRRRSVTGAHIDGYVLYIMAFCAFPSQEAFFY